jgi:addiction module HigA family antidote
MNGSGAQSRWKLSTTVDVRESNFLCVVHPGEILGEELEELGISARALARQIGVPPNRVTQIVRGERGVSGDTALRLGHWFGMSAEFWMNLQKTYELNLARVQVGEEVAKLPRRQQPKEEAAK